MHILAQDWAQAEAGRLRLLVSSLHRVTKRTIKAKSFVCIRSSLDICCNGSSGRVGLLGVVSMP